jgi:hypothetical protein
MAGKKIYVHFERPIYVGGKSELLKAQMEILYLKKLLKNLALTRTKKIQYRKMLEETMFNLKTSLEKLDLLMPDQEIQKSEIPYSRKKVSKPKEVKKEVIQKPIVKKDEIEEELLKIKQKLDSLNRV